VTRADPKRTEADLETFATVLGKRATRATLSTLSKRQRSQSSTTPMEQVEEEPVSDASTGKKRKRDGKKKEKTPLVTPPATPADAAFGGRASRAPVPRTKQRVTEQVVEEEEPEEEVVEEEVAGQDEAWRAAEMENEDLASTGEEPVAKRSKTMERWEEDDEQVHEEEEQPEDLDIEEAGEPEIKDESRPKGTCSVKSRRSDDNIADAFYFLGFFSLFRNLFSTPQPEQRSIRSPLQSPVSEEGPEEDDIQMEEEPEEIDDESEVGNAVVERKQDSQLSTIEIDAVEEFAEEDADGLEDYGAQGASSAVTVSGGGMFSDWFSGRESKGKEKQVAIRTRENVAGQDQTEIERIKREAAAASDRLDTVEKLLDGIEASARQKVLAATKRFEVERTESAVRYCEMLFGGSGAYSFACLESSALLSLKRNSPGRRNRWPNSAARLANCNNRMSRRTIDSETPSFLRPPMNWRRSSNATSSKAPASAARSTTSLDRNALDNGMPQRNCGKICRTLATRPRPILPSSLRLSKRNVLSY